MSLVGAVLLGVPSSSAAITLGETFDPSTGSLCSDEFTRLQPPTATQAEYEAPAAGAITSWSFHADAAPPDLKFKVGRPEGGGFFTIIGESELVSPVANQLNTYAVEIPVQRGDVIGSYTTTSVARCSRAVTGYPIYVEFGEVLVGETNLFVDDGNQQLDLSAELEPYRCAGRNATIGGSPRRDTLVGTPGNDVIAGLQGKDKIKGLGGKDRICGGKGKDKLKGGAGQGHAQRWSRQGQTRRWAGQGQGDSVATTSASCQLRRRLATTASSRVTPGGYAPGSSLRRLMYLSICRRSQSAPNRPPIPSSTIAVMATPIPVPSIGQ